MGRVRGAGKSWEYHEKGREKIEKGKKVGRIQGTQSFT